MTKNKSLLALFIALTFCLTGLNSAFAADAPIVSAVPNKKSYSVGESGTLTINFKTGKKIKIPKDPEIEVTIEDGVSGAGMQDYSGNGAGDDYLKTAHVVYNFTVPQGAHGTITIHGKVKFGYCNSEDGVCKIATKTFSAKIKID